MDGLESGQILVVDDERTIHELLFHLLTSEGFACQTAETGAEALLRLQAGGFSVVVADINMPELSGLELLKRLCQDYPDVAVIMITGVSDLRTAVQAMKQGACDYITKPFDIPQVLEGVERALRIQKTRSEDRRIAAELRALVQNTLAGLNSALADLNSHQTMTLDVLIKALDAREHDTQAHSQRVQAYTLRLAEEFAFGGDQLVDIGRGALLHDIGKIGVSDAILLKPGRLTPDERAAMMRHPVIGFGLLQGMKFLKQAPQLILHHHEKYDGSGYPNGLRGEAIPLEARIFSVVDAYDAMTSDRCYRSCMVPEAARREILACRRSHFDPGVVEKFLAVPQSDWDRIRAQYC